MELQFHHIPSEQTYKITYIYIYIYIYIVQSADMHVSAFYASSVQLGT